MQWPSWPIRSLPFFGAIVTRQVGLNMIPTRARQLFGLGNQSHADIGH